jgi:hypothetical protein
MRPFLKRIGKAFTLATAENLVTSPVAAAVVGWLHLGRSAMAISWLLNNSPFYCGLWIKEAINERRRRTERRHLGFA